MAKIVNVDYTEMKAYAKEMREPAIELNNEIMTAYKTIEGMHNVWYGKRYNELVKSFNAIIPQINEVLNVVVRDIPYTLEIIATNYAQFNHDSTSVAVRSEPKKIAEIAISNDVGMRFLEDFVVNLKEKVVNCLNNAEDKMNAIESIYTNIKWQSDASEPFRDSFTKLKKDIVKSFSEIKQQFATLMEQTAADIQAAENANTVQ